MKKSKKVLASVLALLMCLTLLASCGGDNADTSSAPPSSAGSSAPAPSTSASPTPSTSSAPPESSAPPALAPAPTEATAQFSETIDIIMGNSSIAVLDTCSPAGGVESAAWVYNLIYDKLVYPNISGSYDPYLATSWETEDYQSYTFHLRDDVTFHNGDKFTAADVIYTIERAQASPGSPANNNWKMVAEANAIDDYTLELVLSEVYFDFILDISMPWCGIVNERAITEDPTNGITVGTGAFMVTDFSSNNSVELTRNDNYWTDTAITKTINLMYVPEQSTRATMMRNGEAQLCTRISDEDIPTFETDPGYQLFTFPMGSPNAVMFNMDHPICSDYNFRMAVAHALNHDDITYGAVGNYGLAPQDGTVWGYDMEYRNSDIPLVEYNPELAREYLAKSSYAGEEIEMVTAIASIVKATEIIQQQLGEVGINTRVNVMDGASLFTYTEWDNNQAEITVYTINFTKAASSIRNVVAPGASGNRMRYDNPEVNDLLARAGSAVDTTEREALYKELQEVIAADRPYVQLFYRNSALVATKGIGGFELPSDTRYDWRYIYWQTNAE